MKTKGYKHQLDTLEWSNDKKHFAFYHEMGCGKSWCLLAHVERGFNRCDYDCLFLIAPKGVFLNWPNKEVPSHLAVNHKCFIWRSGMTQNQQNALWKDLNRVFNGLRIVVMNIEALGSESSMKFALLVLKTFNCMLSIDESTVIKTPTSVRTSACLDLSEASDSHRCIMTGSPITKGPYDLYAQARFLNPNYLGFSSFLAYRNYYAEILTVRTGLVDKINEDGSISKVMGTEYVKGATTWTKGTRKQYEKVLEYKNLDQLQEKIKPWSFRVLKKDCLDLPDKVYLLRDVELTKEQEKAYREMATMWLMEVETGTVTATIALTRLMKLHQILCGHIKNDAGELLSIPSHRPQALLDVIAESSAKVIIWANYQADVAHIRKSLYSIYDPSSVVEFHGGTNAEDREIAKVRFQEDPTCRFWLGTPKAGARGNTLTAASLMIFYSYDFNRDHRWQAEDRAHRIGQDEALTIVSLRAPGTIDDTILNAHRETALIAEQIVDNFKSHLLKELA